MSEAARRAPAWRPWPRSMASRLYLIIFTGLLLAQALSVALVLYERFQSATSVMLNTLENDVGTSVAVLDREAPEERASWLPRLRRDNYRFILGPGDPGEPLTTRRARDVTQMIAREVGAGYRVRGETVSRSPERYQVHFTLHDGSPLTLEITPRGVMPVADWLPAVLVLQVAVLLACGWFAVRQATRPLLRLARAADGITPSVDGPRMAQDGPTEVAHAASAFNAMQDRIGQYLKERLHILASISHDLQTPITRMRLRAESLDEGVERDRLLADLAEMEHLVREGVTYARSAHGGDETPVRIDAHAFLESLVFDYQDTGKPVTLTGSIEGVATVRPRALRRVLGNLVDNAVKYGGSAEVGVCRDGGALCITVSDRGPGIPEGELDDVMQPFYRLEASRNRDTGGAGLGLAIALQLMRSIGGNLTLANREGGGLVATVVLP
ncbi:HAMP domain-containing sensor histidine kinase [Luteibacter sp. 329MFSha]|uniref:sensor histidine kinase n=1 Tax=Luteibacter sp. 329MFSha TaxID=1798239 RepID=UPI0008D74A9E|nr:HAMP domain-containing sensor histidine kinase [Luteibacter sp. 329MFSha]SEW27147.1 Signal transduction histidine kinase [Luteibacter sp. 329MFSha]